MITSTINPYNQKTLILNKTCVSKNDSFYFELFRIPEILNRLKQYKEILNENDIKIPFWVYNLTEDIQLHSEGGGERHLTHFLTGLGFFDRYISKYGWPKYIIGKDPLISVVLKESSFEEQALLLTKGFYQESQGFHLYETSSYCNVRTGCFHLTGLKRKKIKSDIKSIFSYVKEKQDDEDSFQFLTPHEEHFMEALQTNGVFPKDFLEVDTSLKWLWPLWKKNQISQFNKVSSKKYSR